MTAEVTPRVVNLSYTGLKCPTTGKPCPGRTNIAQLCLNDMQSAASLSPDMLKIMEDDSRAQSALLLGHNILINQYGCETGPVDGQCPPNVLSSEQPAIRGLKKLIKYALRKKN